MGRHIRFTGDLAFDLNAAEKARKVVADEIIIKDYKDVSEYKQRILTGKILPTGHTTDVGGQPGFSFVSDDVEIYHALFGGAEFADIYLQYGEDAQYVSYNLMEYVGAEITAEGYCKGSSNVLIVTQFSRDYNWDNGFFAANKKANVTETPGPLSFRPEAIDKKGNEVFVVGQISDFLWQGEEVRRTVIFDVNKFGGKIPNENFIDKFITLYVALEDFSGVFVDDSAITADLWFYEDFSTSNVYGVIGEMVSETDEFAEFELLSAETAITRFYKDEFKAAELNALTGTKVYLTGDYIDETLAGIRVKELLKL